MKYYGVRRQSGAATALLFILSPRINKNQGVVRIPIQEAMNLIVQKNLLPIRQGTNATPTGPSSLQPQQKRPLNTEGAKP